MHRHDNFIPDIQDSFLLKNLKKIISVTPLAAGVAENDTDTDTDTDTDLGEEPGADEPETRCLTFDPPQHGLRLDVALAGCIPWFSRQYLQQLIGGGDVSVCGKVIRKPAFRVKAADPCVVVLRPTPQSLAFLPESMALVVVYIDDHLMVINKPAGLVVHPAPGHWSGTLMNGLLGFDSRATRLPRAGIVHRLDKDTSGLMVVARSRVVMDALVRAIAARTVNRQYVALAHGAWQGAQCRDINAPIGRDPRHRLRMAVVDLALHPGKPARTSFRHVASSIHGCLVQCSLDTGRTHQIRVHMASMGHPLVADHLYGGQPAAGMQRQALHACHLAFVHPVTSQPLSFAADLPDDFASALVQWGLPYTPPNLPR